MDKLIRCEWCSGSELDMAYHDTEWGVPVYDEGKLFEMLILEGAQAGLSWSTILKKRENYRAAFDDFDTQKIARYNSRRVAKLMANPGIVRNALKINSTIGNAQALLKLKEKGIEFSDFLWQFVDGQPVINQRTSQREVPASTTQSDAMAKALKRAGFKFVGTTICYAFMQAVGMVNDHKTDCFRYKPLAKPRRTQ